MGPSPSLPIPALPTENVMCITFTWNDKITMMYVSQKEVDICRQAVLTHWKNGIQEEKSRLPIENSNLLCYKFKLRATPFTPGGGQSFNVAMRRMATKMLQDLYNIGWKLTVSSDMSLMDDLSTWFFERQMTKPDSLPFFCIAISSSYQLKIIDCPQNILKLLLDVIKVNWKRGIQNDKEVAPGVHKIQLNGSPWRYAGDYESCCARHLIREIISLLWNNQWILYGTGNLKSTADTMFFMYDETRVAGQEFVSLSFTNHNRLRLINVPEHVISSVHDVVRVNWSIKYVCDERPFCFEMKLCGNPWCPVGSEAITSPKLIVAVMERMASIGYYPITDINISRKLYVKPLMVFIRRQPIQTKFFCLSLNSRDLIRIINAPENITEVAKNIVGYWPKGLQDEKIAKIFDGMVFQAKLRGSPWHSIFHGDGFHGRALLLALWTSFQNLGWRLVYSTDVSASYIYRKNKVSIPSDVHSCFFMYDETLLMHQSPTPPPADPNLQPPQYYKPPPSYAEAGNY